MKLVAKRAIPVSPKKVVPYGAAFEVSQELGERYLRLGWAERGGRSRPLAISRTGGGKPSSSSPADLPLASRRLRKSETPAS